MASSQYWWLWQGLRERNHLKGKLIEIAGALGIDSSGVVKELVPRILKHLDEHLELAVAEGGRFQLLFHSEVAKGGGRGKTSIEKAGEERVEKGKEKVEPTGAHKKLLEKGIKSDPPGQHGLFLRKPTEPASDPELEGDDISSMTSIPTTRPNNSEQHVNKLSASLKQLSLKEPLPTNVPREMYDLPLLVNFREVNTSRTEQVPIASGTSDQGTVQIFKEERGGQLWRPGLSHEMAQIRVGLVEKILQGEVSRQLLFDFIDFYPLMVNANSLEYDLVWDPTKKTTPWPVAKTIKDVAKHHIALKDALEVLAAWSLPGHAGYQVPHAHEVQDKCHFKKAHVCNAFFMGTSQASVNAKYFKPKKLAKMVKFRDWYFDFPKSKWGGKFDDMSLKDFCKYQAKKLEAGISRVAKDSGERQGKKRG
ncbi:hypothetical protein JAAARDRAFT_49152 [Jaapia argillacea MUCL 33604]|uniref:Uncharacterized protein n=1 Tax=Jaapia argillacea MUCL 33604 TaxID=933084 RepID=A0A067PVX6_9AGAM|nr:hypothetical protein JAAARDRAFT_49152 [Jaapia argillacea MUCL 33604]